MQSHRKIRKLRNKNIAPLGLPGQRYQTPGGNWCHSFCTRRFVGFVNGCETITCSEPFTKSINRDAVSWYEAEAYAEYAGKNLPTIYEWRNAARKHDFADIVPMSNFSGKSLAGVGQYQGISPYGTYDLAGNAKEWCLNATGNKRFILGGAWNEPSYTFNIPDAQSPFDRATTYGFRCVKVLQGAKPPSVVCHLSTVEPEP